MSFSLVGELKNEIAKQIEGKAIDPMNEKILVEILSGDDIELIARTYELKPKNIRYLRRFYEDSQPK